MGGYDSHVDRPDHVSCFDSSPRTRRHRFHGGAVHPCLGRSWPFECVRAVGPGVAQDQHPRKRRGADFRICVRSCSRTAFPVLVQRRTIQMAGCLDRNYARTAHGRGDISRVSLRHVGVGPSKASSPSALDRWHCDRCRIRSLSPSKGRYHWPPDRCHLRDGLGLRLVEDQVEFNDDPFPGARCVQRGDLRCVGLADSALAAPVRRILTDEPSPPFHT